MAGTSVLTIKPPMRLSSRTDMIYFHTVKYNGTVLNR